MTADTDVSSRVGAQPHDGIPSDVLLLSQRRLADLVAYAITYEFEDVVAELTNADCLDAAGQPALEFSRRAYKLVRLASGSKHLARRLAPNPQTLPLTRDYELFFPVFNHTHEVYALATLPHWRKRSRVAACYIVEAWPHLLPLYLVELLSELDHIFVGVKTSVDHMQRLTGRPCSYLPPACDVMRFAPRPGEHNRSIDVCSVGRRSAVTHQALLALADRREIFYYYDTVASTGVDRKQRTFRVDHPGEHRKLHASLLRNSRYFIANRSRINEPDFTAGREELSSRFYEGVAAGAVLIGTPPDTEEFSRQFDWPDAVIPMAFDCPDIRDVLTTLDRNPDRLERIRSANVANAALRHDWLHRVKIIFETLGLPPTAAMHGREARLNAIAQTATSHLSLAPVASA